MFIFAFVFATKKNIWLVSFFPHRLSQRELEQVK